MGDMTGGRAVVELLTRRCARTRPPAGNKPLDALRTRW